MERLELYVHLQRICLKIFKKTSSQINFDLAVFYPHCSLSSVPCCFSYSAWQIGWIGKPSSLHTEMAPSHPSLDQIYAGCSL